MLRLTRPSDIGLIVGRHTHCLLSADDSRSKRSFASNMGCGFADLNMIGACVAKAGDANAGIAKVMAAHVSRFRFPLIAADCAPDAFCAMNGRLTNLVGPNGLEPLPLSV